MSLKTANKVETNRVELEIEVGAAEFEKAVAAAYKKKHWQNEHSGFPQR